MSRDKEIAVIEPYPIGSMLLILVFSLPYAIMCAYYGYGLASGSHEILGLVVGLAALVINLILFGKDVPDIFAVVKGLRKEYDESKDKKAFIIRKVFINLFAISSAIGASIAISFYVKDIIAKSTMLNSLPGEFNAIIIALSCIGLVFMTYTSITSLLKEENLKKPKSIRGVLSDIWRKIKVNKLKFVINLILLPLLLTGTVLTQMSFYNGGANSAPAFAGVLLAAAIIGGIGELGNTLAKAPEIASALVDNKNINSSDMTKWKIFGWFVVVAIAITLIGLNAWSNGLVAAGFPGVLGTVGLITGILVSVMYGVDSLWSLLKSNPSDAIQRLKKSLKEFWKTLTVQFILFISLLFWYALASPLLDLPPVASDIITYGLLASLIYFSLSAFVIHKARGKGYNQINNYGIAIGFQALGVVVTLGITILSVMLAHGGITLSAAGDFTLNSSLIVLMAVLLALLSTFMLGNVTINIGVLKAARVPESKGKSADDPGNPSNSCISLIGLTSPDSAVESS